MIWTNTIVWVCGKAVFVRRLLTIAGWSRLPHLTGTMIKLKAAKLTAGGALVLCAGGGAWWAPQIIRGGGSFFSPSPFSQQVRPFGAVDTPEPRSAVLFLTAFGGLLVLKRKW